MCGKPVSGQIIEREKPDALLPTVGGQTALNLAMELHRNGILEEFNVDLKLRRAWSTPRGRLALCGQ